MLFEKKVMIGFFILIAVCAILFGFFIGTCVTSDFFRDFNIW